MKTHESTLSEQALDREHAELEQEAAEWRRWWRELSEMGQPHFGEMGDRLAKFREHLAAHFQHEEFRGPLAGPMAPRSVGQVDLVWQEHSALLAELDRLIDRLHCCAPDVSCWGEARADFEAFLDRLHRHEAHEADIIRQVRHGETA